MRAGEYGVVCRINCAFDLTGATNFVLHVVRPDGTEFDVDHDRFTVGATDVSTELGTFTAGEYVSFTTADGEFALAGDYDLELVVDFGATKQLRTVHEILTVDE